MKKSAIVLLVLVSLSALFIAGCSSSSYDYNAPPSNAPIGGGCGRSAADVNEPLAGQAARLTDQAA